MPPPMTKPRVVELLNSSGFPVVVVLVTLLMTLVAVWVRPLSVSQETPASTKGWTTLPLKRYLPRSGNSQALAVVALAKLPTTLVNEPLDW